jgi:CubicO group peptidase (beta-lactamase class C family)
VRKFYVLISLILSTLGNNVFAQGAPEVKSKGRRLSQSTLKKINPAVKELVKSKAIPGAVVLVAQNNKVIYFKSFGHKKIETREEYKRDTIFRIFSMTKPITSVGALMLVDKGLLSLDAAVAKYIPSFKDLKVLEEGKLVPPKRGMTVRDLLRHSSGLSYGFFGNSEVDKMYLKANVYDQSQSLEVMVDKLSRLPLAYHPGSQWHYSLSTDVLGRVIEIVSKQKLDHYLKTKIFDPLKMKDTGFYVPKSKLPRLAGNYRPDGNGGLAPAFGANGDPFTRPTVFFSGGGGLVSTADDYLRFAQMLLNGGELDGVRIVKSTTIREMTKNQLAAKLLPLKVSGFTMPKTGFGLGVSVRTGVLPHEPAGVLGEFGWSGAASTSFSIAPKEKVIVLTLTQLMPFSPQLLMTVKALVNAAMKKTQKKFW